MKRIPNQSRRFEDKNRVSFFAGVRNCNRDISPWSIRDLDGIFTAASGFGRNHESCEELCSC
jgi:hypothetical protein